MKIHEYQAKELLRAAGVPVLAGKVARTPDEAAAAFTALGTPICAVKAQIHAGGRGKGMVKGSTQRGVELAKSADDATRIAKGLLDQTLVTIQTGPEGQVVHQVFVESGCAIERELYCAILVDRHAGSPVLIASTAGGMDIEEVAHKTPELIITEPFDPDRGLSAWQTRVLSARLGLPAASWRAAEQFFKALTKAFVNLDASLLEINPLVLTKDGTMVALDAKMTFDDNALFRHKDVAALRDETEEEPAETRAAAAGLSYVKLNGTIGCLVNGAGLAMSTMDLVKYHGGEPANFLDVGGGADVNRSPRRSGSSFPTRTSRRSSSTSLAASCVARRSLPPSSRPRRPSASPSHLSSASRGPKSRRGRRSLPTAARRSSPPTASPTPPRRSSPLPRA